MRNTFRFAILLLAVIAAGLVFPLAWIAVGRAGAATVRPVRASSPETTLSVVSLNMAKETQVDTILNELDRYPELRDADILLLQEVAKTNETEPSVAEEMAGRMGRYAAFRSPEKLPTTLGLGIISRYRLRDIAVRPLPRRNLVFRSRARIALEATADTPFGPVRIADAHLDTRINPELRAQQLLPVIEDADRFGGASIIGGDLNTNDLFWLVNIVPIPAPGRQAMAVQRLMASYGFLTPFSATGATFDHLGMQLDWIFTNRLQAINAGVQAVEFSDHHALRAEFRPKQ